MKFDKFLLFFRKRLGLTVLFLFLIFLNLSSLKPQFHLVGWDNFSSFFNLKTNLFRTFFSTWREYRGLGAPSDSEVVDLFRQIFFFIFSPFVKTTLLDQIYVLLCLNIGVLGIYFFTRRFLKHVLAKEKHRYLDFAAFIASFFYLFNLDTLATFYFPMTMYVNRFASLPILFFIFFKLIRDKAINFRTWVLVILAFLFTSTSYLTATIFVVFLVFIFLFSLFLGNYKRQVLVFFLFISLNLFWLLPFANYTLERSAMIELAPTFVDANEIQLNRPASFYSLSRLLFLYPNFLDTKITDIAEGVSHYLHPGVDSINAPLGKMILFVFPFFYLSGLVLILAKYKKKFFLWIPLFVVFSLFLVGKEYTPLGSFYSWIKNILPYFDILFRFADTKFNVFISFGGSISAALFFVYLLSRFKRHHRIIKISSFLVLFLTVFVFSSYFKGNLIAPFMYNKVPSAYFQIAETVNKDKGSFRVLHLPLDKDGYWKSYVWGMTGSSFLNFILDKPLVDRTFEPASMENAYLHEAIFQLISNTQSVKNQEKLDRKSEKFYQLLRKTGIKYVIWDETVSNIVYSRGINFWGEFNSYDTREILKGLEKLDLLQAVVEYELNILDYLDIYPRKYSLNQDTINRLTKDPYFSIQLFEVKEPLPKFYFTQQAEFIDPNLDNLLASNLVLQEQNYVQDEGGQTNVIFPFQRQNAFLAKNKSEISFNFENPFQDSGQFFVDAESNNLKEKRYYVEIFAKIENENLILSFYHLPFPVIQNQRITEYLGETTIPLAKVKPYLSQAENSLDNFFSDWQIMEFEEISDLRLRINELVLPLPSELNSKERQVATIVVSEEKMEIELLAKDESGSLDLADFQLTEDPNCFKDKIEDHNFSLNQVNNSLVLFSKNGSTCLFKTIKKELGERTDHLEIKFDLEAEAKDLDSLYPKNLGKTAKPLLKDYLLSYPKPNLFSICIKDRYIDDCLNKHQVLSLKDKQVIIVPLEKPLKNVYELSVLLAAKNITFQEQEIVINSVVVDQFKIIDKKDLEVKLLADSFEISLDKNKDINLQIPKALSNQSFYFDKEKDGFYFSNQPCQEKENSYRTFRIIDNNLISFFENCSNLISVRNNFSSNSFYLWAIDYHLFSGKYPKYILDDGFYFYKNNYLSLDQGYPDIPFFKSLQKPEGFLARLNKSGYQKQLKEEFTNTIFQSAYTFIYSQPELDDQKFKDYTLHQDSENEGILSLSSFDVLELPNSWQNLTIRRLDNNLPYTLSQEAEYKQILPSLWQVSFQARDKPLLLAFNEAYDQQWRVYKNFFNLFLGKEAEGFNHLKFNGYANAWEINKSKTGSFLVFYTPEKLAWLGWSLTLATTVLGFIVLKFWILRNKRKINQLN